jgi:hypothetical protein
MPAGREKLLPILARLDQISADADSIIVEPIGADIREKAEAMRDLLRFLSGKIEGNRAGGSHGIDPRKRGSHPRTVINISGCCDQDPERVDWNVT